MITEFPDCGNRLAFVVKMRCLSPWTGLRFLFFEDDVFHLPYWTNLWDVMDSWQGPEGTGGGKQELDKMKTELQSIGAVVNLVKRRSIISLICNVKRSSLILEKVKQSVLYSYWFVVMGTWSHVAGLQMQIGWRVVPYLLGMMAWSILKPSLCWIWSNRFLRCSTRIMSMFKWSLRVPPRCVSHSLTLLHC